MGEVAVDCVCGKALRLSQLEEHLRVEHIVPSRLPESELQKKLCKGVLEPCPICGKLMQKSSIPRHLGNMHADGSYHTSKSVLTPLPLTRARGAAATTTATATTTAGGEEEEDARGRRKRAKRASHLLADVTASESHSEGGEEEGGNGDASPQTPSNQLAEVEAERKRRHKRDKERERRNQKKLTALALIAPPAPEPVAPKKEPPAPIFDQDFTIFPCHNYVRATGTCTTTPLLVKLTKPKRLRPEPVDAAPPPTSSPLLDVLLQPCDLAPATRDAIARALDQVSLWPEATPALLEPIRARARYLFYREVRHLLADLALALPAQLKPRIDHLRRGI